ncbi:chorismate mutase family protein [Variovorax sp. UC74_104]|uniref:chorismate mutase family protein n=1 Tax=Variovorax sp. UC74_104 TaxID=3374555 RepID=UPI0037577074
MTSAQQSHSTGPQEAVTPAPEGASTGLVADSETAQQVLQSLRDELDGLDRSLLEVLRQRLVCCCRIGLHKRNHAIPMMQPHRIGIVQERAATFAVEHGMSPAFVRTLYELIITETCRLEDEIIGASATSG